jgi:hypothetical protein
MSKQVWGTFSVRDHCNPRAFVSEVMLYDRLVIPVPPDDAERMRWQQQGWDPDRLDRLLKILGERAYQIKWNKERRDRWKARFDAGSDVANKTGEWAFMTSRSELTFGLPSYFTGVQAVTNYTSLEELESDLGLKPSPPEMMPYPGGASVAILGHEFFVPNDPRWTHEELLTEAVELSSDRPSQRKRASFWRWQREFFDDKGITDQSAIQEAVEEMYDLLEEEKSAIVKKQIRTATQFAFLTGSVALGMVGGPLSPVGVGAAFISIGRFVADKFLESPGDSKDKPVSLFYDIKKHFGWK